MKLFTSFAAGLAVLATQSYADLFEYVQELDNSNFEEMVMNDDENLWVVAFYADWCPYCESFDPEYESTASDVKLADKAIKFGAINVMENRETTQKFQVRRTPTVKIFGKDKQNPETYEDARKKVEMVTFLEKYTKENEFLKTLEAATYHYNVDNIITQIRVAHEVRIAEAEKVHKEELAELYRGFNDDQTEVKDEFADKLTDLGQDREDAVADEVEVQTAELAELKRVFEDKRVEFNAEAVDLIESIATTAKKNEELSTYIDTLGKEWLKIEWNDKNRVSMTDARKKAAAAAPAPRNQYPSQQQQRQAPMVQQTRAPAPATGYSGYAAPQQASRYGQAPRSVYGKPQVQQVRAMAPAVRQYRAPPQQANGYARQPQGYAPRPQTASYGQPGTPIGGYRAAAPAYY